MIGIPAYVSEQMLRSMNVGIKAAFSRVKEEMSQHLETINQNTNEVQACYEYLAELDAKVEKLAERLDSLQLAVGCEEQPSREIRLTHREQEAFLVLYTLEDPVTAAEIARRLGLTGEMVEQQVASLEAKGVPILRTFVNGRVYHSLDLKFKELQARRNVVNISQSLSEQLLQERSI